MIDKAQRIEIFNALDAEAMKAAKAYAKAVKAYDDAITAQEREMASLMLEVRLGQVNAARNVLKSYFDNYLTE